MSCPTCDHTMHNLGVTYYWCPRCGTIQQSLDFKPFNVNVPKLVGRCRQYECIPVPFNVQPLLASEWQRLGIAESINKPEDRS